MSRRTGFDDASLPRLGGVRLWRSRCSEAARTVLGAYASIVFANDLRVGAWVLAASCVDWRRGVLGVLGALSGRQVLLALRVASEPTLLATYTCCSALVGMALPTLAWGPSILLAFVAGGVAACLTVVLSDLLWRLELPVFALPFVLVGSCVHLVTSQMPIVAAPLVQTAASLPEAVVQSLGALLWAPRIEVGLIVLAAIGLWSRWGLGQVVLGSAIGWAVARSLGQESSSPAVMIAQYNAALTMLALGAAVGLPSGRLSAMALGGTVAAAAASVAAGHLFERLMLPVLAWPFVIASLAALRLLRILQPSWFTPTLLAGQSPEANREYQSTLLHRLGLPGPPRLALPVSGRWCITQGVEGGVTHTGPWAFALDFEMLDADGFPFRGSGEDVRDYYCYGQPVHAPGYGTVAAVLDGQRDESPGDMDLVRPWGNCVIIYHGPKCYSVLAHLKHGSILVKVGQPIVPGQRIAACGASGRSPRPHLHLQVQASVELGAEALPFVLLDYMTRAASGPASFARSGVPREWDVVWSVTDGLRALPRGWSLESMVDGTNGRSHTLTIESVGGEHYLTDSATDERLYFVPSAAGVVLTTLRGQRSGLMGSLLQLLPFVPAEVMGTCRIVERIPLSNVDLGWRQRLGLWWRIKDKVAEVRMDMAVDQQQRICVRSEIYVGRGVDAKRIKAGRVLLGSEGLLLLEMEDSTGRVVRSWYGDALGDSKSISAVAARGAFSERIAA